MQMFRYRLRCEMGLHARPAERLVRQASRFESAVTIERAGQAADCKRLLCVIGLGARDGDEVTVSARGPDERAACELLRALFEAQF